MSDERNPDLTLKQQQAQDQERVQGQLVVTDVTRQVQSVMDVFSFGSSGPTGRTSFEGHELNAMIDLIENSNPENLEEAGRALFKARTAITDASTELKTFIDAVEWEGESGTAFRDWGKDWLPTPRSWANSQRRPGPRSQSQAQAWHRYANPCLHATAA
ncbi:hypothetical protein NKH18_37305 [Streptomyces sp. M10(2022)]